MFMVRYGPVNSSRRKKHPFHGNFGFGIFTLEQLGSDQQVVKTMDDIYPGIELWELHKISMLQKRKTRLQNKVWQGHFYFVLTKKVAQFSAKEQAFFTTNKCETLDSAEYSDQCYCEKKKTIL